MNKKLYIIIGLICFGLFAYFIMQENSKQAVSEGDISQNDMFQEQKAILELTPESPSKVDITEEDEPDELDEIDVAGFPKVEPYTGKLPPYPDLELNNSTLLGIDANRNGVRDDREHSIVGDYYEDKDVVEAMFAYERVEQLNLQMTQYDQWTEEAFEKFTKRDTLSGECQIKYFKQSEFISDVTELYPIVMEDREKRYNTKLRKKMDKKLFSLLNNRVILSRSVSEKECQEFFEETRNYGLNY